MDVAELQDVVAELMDHVAEATGHTYCEDPGCVLCSDVTGRDPFSLLAGLGEAIGMMAADPRADAAEAVEGATYLLQYVAATPAWTGKGAIAPLALLGRNGPFQLDPATAQRVYVFLKALAVNLALGGAGHPRIET